MLVTILTIAQVVVALALIVVVLLQHGKQQGLSGAIAGGAETFFGKNKGRTIDVMLKKFTSVVAILFIALSLTLTFLTTRETADNTAEDAVQTEQTDAEGNAETVTAIPIQLADGRTVVINADNTMTDGEGNLLTMNEENLVYEDGSVYASTADLQAALENMQATAEAVDVAEEGGEAPAENAEAPAGNTAE